MRASRCFAAVLAFLTIASFAFGAWTETADINPGSLDIPVGDNGWVAAYSVGSSPATDFPLASTLAGTYGTDPGWSGNVVKISDATATGYAAINRNPAQIFTDVRVSVACTPWDLNDEFGVIARSSLFEMDDPVTEVDGYAATLSFIGVNGNDYHAKFSLHKIVGGALDYTKETTWWYTDFDDGISFVELTVDGNLVVGRIYEDMGDTSPMAELSFTDTDNPLVEGYSGVVLLDATATNGIGAYYDTLVSEAIPEPSTLALLFAGLLFGLISPRRRR